ncbi:clustered mitochondria protein homolog [Lytechinus pictus]|uniref:clustered mitochondria protein homolog n=1 Tax=Lytechinus pictus TaxID=7653 RepID=UPI0030BA0F83
MAEPAPIVNGVDNPHPLPINGADDGAGSSGDVTPNSEDSGVDCMHVDALELKEAVANGNSRRDAVEEEGKEEGTEEEKKDAKVEDVIVIQDAAFMVKLVPPSGEPFDLQVSPQEMVQEIHQVLMDREDTCHRTCFSLQLDGNVLDNFAELKNIEGLKDGSIIKVVEEPYTVREARIHVRHVRDLLKSLDPSDAYNGVDCQSLSFLSTVLSEVDRKRGKSSAASDVVDCTPPEFIMPSSKERPLLPMQPAFKENNRSLSCLKVLTLSGWNPPPGTRRMHGDLMYLYVVCSEGTSYHLTASTRGFYINQSTQEVFNPKPADQKHLSHSLIELLNKVSPSFKKNFAQLLKKRSQRHPFERVPTPFQVYSWLAPQMEHTVDSIRAEDAYTSRLGYEEHIPGQTRDWNEEIQTTRELARKNLPERLLRERAIFKVHSDFVAAATRGAMAVIDGNVMAINPGEDSKMQMFIWNNIFFSLGFDVRDHYKDFGGDHAAYVAPGNDLKGVKAYNTYDLDGLYTLGTVVVDYRGYRITAQSIIPGILEREQEESVIYGSIDFGKTVVTNDKYKELLTKTSQHLKILPHYVMNQKDEEIEIYSSIECKGIKGNDGRHYVLDLLRTFPPDVNFLQMEAEDFAEDMKKSGFPRQHRHKLACLRQEVVDAFVEHRYMVFIRHAALMLMHNQQPQEGAKLTENGQSEGENPQPKEEKETSSDLKENSESKDKMVNGNHESKKNKEENEVEDGKEDSKKEDSKKENSKKESNESIVDGMKTKGLVDKCPVLKNMDSTEGNDLPKELDSATEEAAKALATSPKKEGFDPSHKEVIALAAQAAGSLSSAEFDVRFNPDVYADGVIHAPSEAETLGKQRKLLKDAARFIVAVQIPTFVQECKEHSIAPLDGYTLVEMLHQRGINIRYMGVLAEKVVTCENLSYLYRIIITELICRSVKHVFKAFMQGIPMTSLSAAISHFLNCFLSSLPNPLPPKGDDELSNGHHKKKKNKKRIRYVLSLGQENTSWSSLTPSDLWSSIKVECKEYFHYKVKCESIDSVTERYNLQKMTLLREFCSKLGVQLLLRDYELDSKNKPPFNENDILNMFPKVKHINPTASDAYHFFQSGQTKIQQGCFREGFELISEALNLFNNVYGPMHPEIAACMRTLARLHYLMGEQSEAIEMQHKAVMMSERCNGLDHPNTITEYMHLALYRFAAGQAVSALKLMYRARYLTLLIHGEDHPEMALFDSNIGLVLHGVNQFELALKFLEKALETNIKYFGAKSLKAAHRYHLVARTHSCCGDFRSALRNEKDAYTIYREQFGDNHEKTKESSECLSYLTQQAVTLQKTMNEIKRGGPKAALRPIPISHPSMSSVLETLNMINGIFLIPVSIRGIQKATVTEAQPENKEEVTVTNPTEKVEDPASPPPESQPADASPAPQEVAR